jgi:hypothetical protein
MTKAEMIQALKGCYRVANASDSHDSPERQPWTDPAMAGEFCRALDDAFRALQACGVLSSEEHQAIYDTL